MLDEATAQWYLALAHLQRSEKEQGIALLNLLIHTDQYQEKATQLLHQLQQ